MTALMILLAFSGLAHNNGTMDRHSSGVANMIVGKHNNITTLNTQEMHDLQEFMKYNLIHYGLHSGKLDKLQYKADMNFLTWYIGNFSQIPSAYRGITQQNASVMLPIWENESVQAQSDVQEFPYSLYGIQFWGIWREKVKKQELFLILKPLI